MRIVNSLLLALACGVLALAARLPAMISAGAQKTVASRPAHAAAMCFEAGTGWGGDDAALDVVLSSRRLRGYVRRSPG